MGDNGDWNDDKNSPHKIVGFKKYCYGCLCVDDKSLQNYKFQCGTLKNVLQMDCVQLCYLCKRIAERSDHFIQNVQSNQILLENFHNIVEETLKSVQKQSQPLVNLCHKSFEVIELTVEDRQQTDDPYALVMCHPRKSYVDVKIEMKEEEIVDHLEGEFINGCDDFSDSAVKDEDSYPLKPYLKEEIEFEDVDSVDLMSLRAALKQNKLGKKNKIQRKKKLADRNKLTRNNTKSEKKAESAKIETICITRQECLEERTKMRLQDKKYLGCAYKCDNCIKGFNLKESYEKHLEKHSQSMGDFECDICYQRMDTDEKLVSHMKYHLTRYKCAECGLIRICRFTIKDHYSAYHSQDKYQFTCAHCSKSYKRQLSLRKHIMYTHSNKERIQCGFCKKTYANKEVLKSHMLNQHPKEVTTGPVSKKYACEECGMAFKSPSLLRIHGMKHSHRRDYYCVECDKSFKSDAALKSHLKMTAPHVNYVELPLPCLHCDKRFATKRNLERHVNRIHLNFKPYSCDNCDKAYDSKWSLTQHIKLIHEGYKRPLQYPCPMCDKLFDRKHILKNHIRIHTGERPYQCSKCPAQFNQASILTTHDRLVHLKLTRDGRPKASMK